MNNKRIMLYRAAIFLMILIAIGGLYLATSRGWLPYTGIDFLHQQISPNNVIETGEIGETGLRTPLIDTFLSVTPTRPFLDPPTSTPPSPIDLPVLRQDLPDGLILLSLREGLFDHLFFFHPDYLPLTRITEGDWNDIHPAISPDERKVAFSSNRNGFYDLFIMDLDTGEIQQITETPDFDGSPDWSPDGKFLVYESYVDESLEIFVLDIEGEQEPIQLTFDPGADHSPTWSPLGREIAFVSTRSGEPEVWTADLQNPDERFKNISNNPDGWDLHPTWSPEGDKIAYASNHSGIRQILIWDSRDRNRQPITIGNGDWPVWHPNGEILLTTLETPNQPFLTAYTIQPRGLLALPVLPLPGGLKGLVWAKIRPPIPLPDDFARAAQMTPPSLWSPVITPIPDIPEDRKGLVPLDDVEAPDPRLQDISNESFEALRESVTKFSGWDFLATLENAFVPLTAPLLPGMGDDWLYTGRAIAVNTSPINAGWIKVVREDFGYQTFWRVYLLSRFQDGSQGVPLHSQPWALNARFNGDPFVFEEGGTLEDTPSPGYWLDFTEIAGTYGWERVPALLTWRTFYQGTRFNEFVHGLGVDWRTAMLELYPPEVLITPSPITPVTPSLVPTRTPTSSATATPTRTPSPTNTLRATQTDTPKITPTPTPTSPNTLTLTPTVSPTSQ